jgi:hypothetical protein
VTYTLYRIEDDSSLTPVSRYTSLAEAACAAGHVIEDLDHDFAYELHTLYGRVALFGEGRIGYRQWAIRTGRISPRDPKVDHVELLAS